MSEAVRPAPVRIADPEAAARLVAETLTTMQALEALLARESDHIRVGRLAEGLAEAPQKTALAGAYLQGLQAVKANAVALARFAPEGVAALREAHGRFSTRWRPTRRCWRPPARSRRGCCAPCRPSSTATPSRAATAAARPLPLRAPPQRAAGALAQPVRAPQRPVPRRR